MQTSGQTVMHVNALFVIKSVKAILRSGEIWSSQSSQSILGGIIDKVVLYSRRSVKNKRQSKAQVATD